MAYDDMSFSKAFAAARKEMGAGKTFSWKGKSYSTNYKEESGASTPKPKARPARLDATSGASRSTEGKVSPKSGAARSTAGKVGAGANSEYAMQMAKEKGKANAAKLREKPVASASISAKVGVAGKGREASVGGRMGAMPAKLSPQEMGKLTPAERAKRNQQATLARAAQRKAGMAKGGMASKKGC
jgi:hypothetical protein